MPRFRAKVAIELGLNGATVLRLNELRDPPPEVWVILVDLQDRQGPRRIGFRRRCDKPQQVIDGDR